MRVRFHALAVLAGVALLAPASAALAQAEVTVDSATVAALQPKLDAFAASLSPAGRAIWAQVLARAAAAPADDPAGATVDAVRFRPAATVATTAPREGPGGMAVGHRTGQGIVVQGGRTGQNGIIVQGGRTAGEGIVVQGGIIVQGGIVVQGGRTASDADVRAFNDQLAALGRTLSPAEQAAVDWLMDRAARGSAASASDGSLVRALGGPRGALRRQKVKFKP